MRSLAVGSTVIAVLLIGCGDEDESPPPPPPPPAQVVAEAARTTFNEATLDLDLVSGTASEGFTAGGLIEPRDGQFRVTLGRVRSDPPLRVEAVVGLEGTGLDSTMIEGPLFGGGDRHCWLNTHAPAGYFEGSISVQESVRLVGAMLESLRDETRQVSALPDGGYDVVLARSAQDTAGLERVWDSRRQLGSVSEMVVELDRDQQRIAGISVTLADYEPYAIELRGNGPRIPRVEVSAELSSTGERLEIDPPRCQAIE